MNKALMLLAAATLALAAVLLLPVPTKQTLLPPLETHAERAIELSAPKLSSVRKKLIATMITGIAERHFTSREHQEWWITLLGVESGYVGRSRSSTGAIGIGQLIPSYKADFGRTCGLTEVDREDLDDDFVNATLSACYFRAMIDKADGNIPLALTMYNAGPHSSGAAAAKRAEAPNEESSKYVTKAWLRKNRALDAK